MKNQKRTNVARRSHIMATVLAIAITLSISTESASACMFLDGTRIETQEQYDALTDEERSRIVVVNCIKEPASTVFEQPIKSYSVKNLKSNKKCTGTIVAHDGDKYRLSVSINPKALSAKAKIKVVLPDYLDGKNSRIKIKVDSQTIKLGKIRAAKGQFPDITYLSARIKLSNGWQKNLNKKEMRNGVTFQKGKSKSIRLELVFKTKERQVDFHWREWE